MRKDFAVFIITHGRADNQRTLETLLSKGYSGQWFLVLDDQDESIQEYINNYTPERIIVFDKNHYINTLDSGMTAPVAKFAVFARNAVEDIARELGYKYFMILDDDIYNIRLRYDSNGSLKTAHFDGVIDEVFNCCLEYMDYTDIECLMFGVCNMYRSGVSVLYRWTNSLRVSVNCFIRNVKYSVKWRLNMFEDLITDLDYNRIGQKWITFVPIQIDVGAGNGKVSGGNTDVYRTFDGFKMAFMPLMVYPDCNDINFYKDHWKPITHAAVTMNHIISDRYQKPLDT